MNDTRCFPTGGSGFSATTLALLFISLPMLAVAAAGPPDPRTPACVAQSGSFCDLGDGTILDFATNLQWEKKEDVGLGFSLHDHEVQYPMAGYCSDDSSIRCQPDAEAAETCRRYGGAAESCRHGCPEGAGRCGNQVALWRTVFTWINDLNRSNFAGHSDWRIPSAAATLHCRTGTQGELESIRDPGISGCGFAPNAPCIDPIFGPSQSGVYWAYPRAAGFIGSGVRFHDDFPAFCTPFYEGNFVRAVRGISHLGIVVGEIVEIAGDPGEVVIRKADGEPLDAVGVGTKILRGETVETFGGGAVNIVFPDGFTLLLDGDSEIRIDDFEYFPDEESGRTFLSILKGIFVYTAGLIGHDDPGNVRYDGPVGQLGIRGRRTSALEAPGPLEFAMAYDETTMTQTVHLAEGSVTLTSPARGLIGDYAGPITIELTESGAVTFPLTREGYDALVEDAVGDVIADTDDDGTRNDVDPCWVYSEATAPSIPPEQNPLSAALKLTNITDPTKASVQFSGLFNPPAEYTDFFATPVLDDSDGMDPFANGAHVVVEADGTRLLDVTVPGGSDHCGNQGDGWSVRSTARGRKWAYKNRSGVIPPECSEAGAAQGLASISVQERLTRDPSGYAFKIKTKGSPLLSPLPADVASIKATVSFGQANVPGNPVFGVSREARVGHCAEVVLDPTDAERPDPVCRLKPDRDDPSVLGKLGCKGPRA